MKTISLISQKGGAGKTTLALHLAVAAERAGFPVAVLDLDPQASAAGWADARSSEAPSVTSIQASRLDRALTVASASGAAVAVLDTAPHSADAAIAAAEASDLILIPCRAGILDLRAIGATAKIAHLSGKRAFGLLSHAPPRAPRLVEDAIAAIQTHRLPVCPVVIHQRSAFGHALTIGQTAEEYEPDGRAAAEIAALWQWVKRELAI